jgi:hypothetical protein
MANLKISQLTPGAPAQATDLLPIDRAGANYSLQVSDVLAEGIVGGSGTPAPGVVASRVLLAQASVDGNYTQALYTVPTGQAGVYQISCGANPRTQSSTSWLINVDVAPPSGTHLGAYLSMSVNIDSGAVGQTPTVYTLYLHAGDVITCGTLTSSGSNSGGTFDVNWVVTRLV